MEFRALKDVFLDNKVKPRGSVVKIDDAELADRLMERGSIGPVEEEAPSVMDAFTAAQNDESSRSNTVLKDRATQAKAEEEAQAKIEERREYLRAKEAGQTTPSEEDAPAQPPLEPTPIPVQEPDLSQIQKDVALQEDLPTSLDSSVNIS